MSTTKIGDFIRRFIAKTTGWRYRYIVVGPASKTPPTVEHDTPERAYQAAIELSQKNEGEIFCVRAEMPDNLFRGTRDQQYALEDQRRDVFRKMATHLEVMLKKQVVGGL